MGKTITPDMIGWGLYSLYEGPYFRGQYSYEGPRNPDFLDKALMVITATEGGKFDAVNMYDRCVVSVGIIQWCDANYFLTTKLLGKIADEFGPETVIGPLTPALKSSNAMFKRHPTLGWRFWFLDDRGVVDTVDKQRQLYLKCTGHKGSWSSDAKEHARLWTACLANVWHDERVRRVQVSYTKPLLMGMVMPAVRTTLFSNDVKKSVWIDVARAAYLSFAANIPLTASQMYVKYSEETKLPIGTREWTIGLIRTMTWGPGISIYPGRYDKIRPVLEKLWDVELPKNAQALKMMADPPPPQPEPPPTPHPPLNVSESDVVPIKVDPPVVVVSDIVPISPVTLPEATKLSFVGMVLQFIWRILSFFNTPKDT